MSGAGHFHKLDAETRAIIGTLIDAGWQVWKTSRNHLRLRAPNTNVTLTYAPHSGCPRARKNFKAEVRRVWPECPV